MYSFFFLNRPWFVWTSPWCSIVFDGLTLPLSKSYSAGGDDGAVVTIEGIATSSSSRLWTDDFRPREPKIEVGRLFCRTRGRATGWFVCPLSTTSPELEPSLSDSEAAGRLLNTEPLRGRFFSLFSFFSACFSFPSSVLRLEEEAFENRCKLFLRLCPSCEGAIVVYHFQFHASVVLSGTAALLIAPASGCTVTSFVICRARGASRLSGPLADCSGRS